MERKRMKHTYRSQKRDGFKDEQYFIIPTESFKEYLKHPLVKAMYLTDIGFFPKAYHHYREREEGTEEYILLYCTEGGGYIHIGNKSIIFTLRKCSVYQETRSINIMPVRRIREYLLGTLQGAKIQAIIHWKNTRSFR